MEEDMNVFVSAVPVNQYDSTQLYDLIEATQAEPVKPIINTEVITKFIPTEKTYVSKKISKKKVKTVQQIRKTFEDYVYEYLPTDLEKQHKYIFDKILRGSSREEYMIERGKKLLKSSNPMLRSTWQMLVNMNVQGQANPKQYVLWNGRKILVSGSKGGSTKFLRKFDAGTKTFKSLRYKTKLYKKQGLLNTSLSVKFKPGPLAKKETLDASFQKYTIGSTTLMPLPEVSLEITTTCGVSLNPHLYGYIQNSREKDGVLAEEWINFALSSLKTNNSEGDNVATFKLKYKNNQKIILMRENKNIEVCEKTDNGSSRKVSECDTDEHEIKKVLSEMITSIEISLMQDSLIIDDDEKNNDPIKIPKDPSPQKDRMLKPNNELKKLDVTVIHVDDSTEVQESECFKPYCTMGCICSSLQCKLQLKNHCSSAKCVLNCTCDYKKYCVNDSNFNDRISGLIHLDKKNYSSLAKEEQKFHQTVVFTEGKGIVLSAKRRTTRMTKKYEDYLSSLTGRLQEQQKELLIPIPHIDCSNIEMWCMVHELYRCFCKGKFLTRPVPVQEPVQELNVTITEIENDLILSTKVYENNENRETEKEIKAYTNNYKDILKEDDFIDVISVEPHIECDNRFYTECTADSESNDMPPNLKNTLELDESSASCSRTRPFTIHKIKAETIEKRQADTLINMTDSVPLMTQRPSKLDGWDNTLITNSPNISNIEHDMTDDGTNIKLTDTPDHSSLGDRKKWSSQNFALWLERCYILLKKRMDANHPIILEKPVSARVILFPWLALLKRYQMRSNYFLVNLLPPNQVVIAVNPTNPDFKSYTNIKNLRVDELSNLPYYVRHLVIETALTNNFVILRGQPNCWQILGTVSKNSENNSSPSEVPSNVFQSTTVPLEPRTNSLQLLELLKESSNSTTSDDIFTSKKTNDTTNVVSKVPKESVSSSLTAVADVPVKTNRLTTYSTETTYSHLVPTVKERRRNTKHKSGPNSLKRKTDEKRCKQSQKKRKHSEHYTVDHSTKISTKNQTKPVTLTKMTTKTTRISFYNNKNSTDCSSSRSHRRKQKFSSYPEEEPLSNTVKKNISSDALFNTTGGINAHKSRWFVMTVENDFTQLQFYNKNVFVTHTTIISAIELARSSEQTVILPLSKMKSYNDSGPQFGIYAMPVKDKACVLIGPYERNEGLCMKTVKEPNTPVSTRSTRGVWLITKKIDDSNVLEDPLSYLPEYSNRETQNTKTDSYISEKNGSVNIPTASPNNNKTISGLKSNVHTTELTNAVSDVIDRPLSCLPKYSNIEMANANMNVCISEQQGPVNASSTFHYNDTTNSGVKRNVEQNPLTETVPKKVTKVKEVSQIIELNPLTDGNSIRDGLPTVLMKIQPDRVSTIYGVKKVVKPITVKRNSLLKPPYSLLKPRETESGPSTSGLSQQPAVTTFSAASFHPKPIITSISSLAASPLINTSEATKLSSTLKSAAIDHATTGISKGGFFVLKPEEINNKALHLPNKLPLKRNEVNEVIQGMKVAQDVDVMVNKIDRNSALNSIAIVEVVSTPMHETHCEDTTSIEDSIKKNILIFPLQHTPNDAINSSPTSVFTSLSPSSPSMNLLLELEALEKSSDQYNINANDAPNSIVKSLGSYSPQSMDLLQELEIEETLDRYSSDSEVYVLSDDDADMQNLMKTDSTADLEIITPNANSEKDVMIECTNIKKLGCIRGRINNKKQVSFQFPGFKYSAFYSEEEASAKINQVLSRKVFVPKTQRLIWKVSTQTSHKLLSQEKLSPEFVVTAKGFMHKSMLTTTGELINKPELVVLNHPEGGIDSDGTMH